MKFLEIFTVVYQEPKHRNSYPTKTTYSTRTEKEDVISLILDFQKDENIKIDRIFSVDEYGRELKHYNVVWRNFRLQLEEVKN